MKHYTEADLLEAQYRPIDERTPVMQHLFECDDCAARWQRLQQKLRPSDACDHEAPKGVLSRIGRFARRALRRR